MIPRTTRRCVILGNGAAGAENQCIGLAERLGVPFEIVRIKPPSALLQRLPAAIHVALGRAAAWISSHTKRFLGKSAMNGGGGDPFFGYDREQVDSQILARGHPDIVIGCGRATAPLSVCLRRHSALVATNTGNGDMARGDGSTVGENGAGAAMTRVTRTIQIQHPRTFWDETDFDLIFTPQHDFPAVEKNGGDMKGGAHTGNIVTTLGSLHRISPAMLASVAADMSGEPGKGEKGSKGDEDSWQTWLRTTARTGPLLVVLVGGSTSTWTMDVPFASRLVRDTCASIDAAAIPSSVTSSVQVGGVLFLTSRRTPPDIVTFLDHRLKQEGDGNGAGTNGGCGPVPFFLWDPRLHGGASLNASHSNASTTVGGAVDAHGAPQASTASVVKDGCWRGNNPYIPSLASASVIIVTPDSVSLASEACSSVGGRVFVANAASTEATCKCDRGTSGQSSGLTIVEGPVRGWEARIGSGTGHLKPKLRRFHRLLWSRGYTSPMTVAGVAGALQEAGKAETMEAGEKQECSRTDGGGSVGGCGDTERGRREGGNWQCLDDTGVAADLIRSHPLFRSILETWHSPLSLPPPPPTSPPPPPPLKMAFDLQ